jgi:hypothetical protein
LWASPTGPNVYRLENSPFFAYGVSWEDLIEVRVGLGSQLEYVRCIAKSGNRTLRVIFQDFRSRDKAAQDILRQLVAMSCTYEGMQPRLVAINVPPETDLEEVTSFLTTQRGLQWEYGDPTFEQISAGRGA